MVVELGLVVLSIGLSLLAGYLLSKKNKSLVQDDKPTTLATRGSYIPLVKGRRRVGLVFGYAGDRATRKEKVAGGKGSIFSGPKVDVFVEDGWHLIAVGPVWALHEIEQNGIPVFAGPITALSHPSGSLIDLGAEGAFRIFWGEDNQPVNTYLGAATRVGVNSRWPGLCYIEWRRKRLGSSPNWPTITYTIETRPQSVHLPSTLGYIPQTVVLGSDTFPISGVLNGVSGFGYFQVPQIVAAQLKPEQLIRISGNTGLGADTSFTVRSVAVVDIGSGMGLPPEVILVARVFVIETITGASANGNLLPFIGQKDDGWNGAHLMAELLFDEWPRGLGLDKAEWDMEAFDQLGLLLGPANENLRCSLLAPDGQDMRGTLGSLMQDLGVLIPIDMLTGLLRPYAVRAPSGTIPHISYDAMLDRPEIDVPLLAGRQVDRLVFSFSEQSNVYRDVTIAVDDDGQATRQEYYRARNVQIVSTTNFNTAARISERRSQEELAGAASYILKVGRAARVLLPGSPITAEGFDEVLRISETKHDPLSGEVEVKVLTDFYGVPLSQFIVNRGVTAGTGQPVTTDLAVRIVELPEALAGAGILSAMVLSIRAHAAIRGHNIHLSADNSTYTFISDDLSIFTGGVLIDSLPAESPQNLAQGPTFTILGPDISSTLDLTSDTPSWRGGRQLAVFVDGTTREVSIAFLQKVTAISSTVYRLDGLILNRYDSRPRTFAPGSLVFILQNDDGLPIQDPLLATQQPLYAKSEPLGIGTLPLAQIAPEAITLYGKGIRPVPVTGIRIDAGSNVVGPGTANRGGTFYRAVGTSPADDLLLRWSYSTPRSGGSGAGSFGWAAAVSDTPPEGDFLVEILTSLDVVVRSTSAAVPSYTYTRVDRLADFVTEPSSFKVRVTQRRGGYSSNTTTQTITRTS